jgi:hypothetical protein
MQLPRTLARLLLPLWLLLWLLSSGITLPVLL